MIKLNTGHYLLIVVSAALALAAGAQTVRLSDARTQIATLEKRPPKPGPLPPRPTPRTPKTPPPRSTSMQPTPRPPPTNSTLARLRVSLICASAWLTLSACATAPTSEPPVIARKPKATPLPAAVSQIEPRPSTEALQKAEQWWQSSGALLSDETPK